MTPGKRQTARENQPRMALAWWRRFGALCLLLAATAITLPAQTFTTLFSFDNTEGGFPLAALVQGADGNLYGTTYGGGAYGNGTIFRITPHGTLTTVYNFCAQTGCSDGAIAETPLVLAPNGNFYSTTRYGGATGNGTVFSLTLRGTLTTLYSFDYSPHGTEPIVGMVQTANGDLFGGTYQGGSTNYGTIFKITPSGMLTTLHTFCTQSGCADGANPLGGLIQATDGNIYGTTASNQGAGGDGTVFKITPRGTLTTFSSFSGADGVGPECALVQATDGNFYGTTFGGGANGDGTVFKITPSGTVTTLYSFCSKSGCTDGNLPLYTGLVQATDGNLYGVTYDGGAYGYGTVFKITLGGTLTTLYSFDGTDGSNPGSSLIQGTDGILYGTTNYGGAYGNGTVFSLAVGLGPFVETVPTSRAVGQSVLILGTSLTGATSVTFNGTAAAFTVKSHSLIAATVPAGATTGTVQVTTPSGTLSSNVPFRVHP